MLSDHVNPFLVHSFIHLHLSQPVSNYKTSPNLFSHLLHHYSTFIFFYLTVRFSSENRAPNPDAFLPAYKSVCVFPPILSFPTHDCGPCRRARNPSVLELNLPLRNVQSKSIQQKCKKEISFKPVQTKKK